MLKIFLWVKILLRDHWPCVINSGTTTKYFPLGRGAHQGNLISVFLFILALEVFLIIKSKLETEGLIFLIITTLSFHIPIIQTLS